MAEIVTFEKRKTILHFDARSVADVPVTTSTGGYMLAQENNMVDESGNKMIYEASIVTRPIVVTFPAHKLKLTFAEK